MLAGCFYLSRLKRTRLQSSASWHSLQWALAPMRERWILLPELESRLQSRYDSEYHLRLVGHVGRRFARRLEGDQLRPDPGGARGDDAGSIPSRVLPPFH